mmetsp:Transcript_3249/g.8788  ORF Transcript_3249/g.8788 Transcript_3249/m.8788 type:complete len:265 (-) Transcript_3249:179-973(-)
MAQAHPHDLLHVGRGHLLPPFPGHQRLGHAVHHDVSPQALDPQRRAHLRDLEPQVARDGHPGQALAGGHDLELQLVLLALHAREEALGVGVVRDAVQHHPQPRLRVLQRLDLHAAPEAVQELRPHLALAGVPAAHHDEARGVGDGDAFALHGVGAAGGAVQHDVHQGVIQEIDLIHVQDAAIGLGQQPGLVRLLPLLQRRLDVDGAAHPVLRGTQRQLHQRRPHAPHPQLPAGALGGEGLGAHQARVRGRRVEGVALHHLDVRQ